MAVALTASFVVWAGFWLLPAVTAGAEARPPQVAGQFYPADPGDLRSLVSRFLQEPGEGTLTLAEKPRILIAPHAGYPYSGSVAAAAFRQVQGRSYDAVVVVGFTHRQPFAGVSIDTREAYLTPLGEIPVALDAVKGLLESGEAPTIGVGAEHRTRWAAGGSSGIRFREEVHAAPEHSLEVMLPFLQVALGDFRLVPILMGGTSMADAEALAKALAQLAGRGDYLFVFSTDLSHYHPYEQAVEIDERTVGAILSESPQAVDRLFADGVLEACGRGPIVTGLLLADRLGYLRRQLLGYANSGDTAGDRSRVVGYAAVGMTARNVPAEQVLSAEAGQALVRAARQTLERVLIHHEAPATIDVERYPELAQAHGVFVTLRRRGSGLLCGCIGRIETDEPLAHSVPLVALDAALRDPRFSPVQGEELNTLHMEVSVLTRPQRVDEADDIVPGRDGVVLERDGHRGVFLPSVWTETGWTRQEFFGQLASQKAGLSPDAWRSATLSIFQDQVFEESEPAGLIAH